MSYHRDLLEQARQLALKERSKPRQASLRRAVSAAYYSLFHLLVDAGSRFLISGNKRERLRLCVTRAFDHRDMREVAQKFSRGSVPHKISPAVTLPLPRELVRLASTFVDLQQARHEADYDLSRSFDRQETIDLVGQVRRAHADWDAVRRSAPAEAFLVALLAHRHMKRSSARP